MALPIRSSCEPARAGARGEGAPDPGLMRLGEGWVAKGGAEGLLCAGRPGLGVALKAEDGARRPLRRALAAVLARAGPARRARRVPRSAWPRGWRPRERHGRKLPRRGRRGAPRT